MTDQRDAESRFGGTRFNLKPMTTDPIYPKEGDSWFRIDQQLIKVHLGGITYGLALVDSSTGKLLASQTPDIAINEVFVVNSEAEMLALDASTGDTAIRQDTNQVYLLIQNPASNLANWQNLADVTASVTSVNGEVGIVTLTTSDIPEGVNLYYTAARFNTAFATKTTSDLAEGTNLYYTNSRFDTRLATKSTSDLPEGTRLYYTQSRFDTAFAGKTTSNLTEGSNLYYTDSRFDARLATKTTSDLPEGSNLYYTIARFDARFSAKTTDHLVEGGVNLYYTTLRANTDFDTRLATKSTSNLVEGSNLYYTDTRVDARITLQKGAVNGLATLDGTGKIPLSQLPGESTTETFIVASQAAMLASGAQKGDIAKRTDNKDIYILTANPASTLGNWEKIVENYDANVETVNGASGVVVLSTTDISEGTNLYYTAARFNSAFAAKSTSDLAEGSNLYYTDSRFDTRFATKTTSNLTEGTNLYYTTTRANTDFDNRLATKTTSNLTEGSNLYYTTSRANTDFDARLLTKTTDNLNEGATNLYYTTARFDARLATKTTSDLAEGTNLYYTNSRADARIALQKGAVNGIATLDGSGKIPTSQLPALAITDTFVIASQAAMLALTAETGDVAVRTDLSKSFILAGSDPSILANWQELLTPTDTVLSVNGQTGVVVLTTTNIAEGTNLYYTDTRFDTRFATKTTTNLAEGTNLYYTDARVRLNRLDQLAAPTANVSMNSNKLTNVTDPTTAQDAATKNYVDSLLATVGEMYMVGNTTVTTIGTQSVFVVATGTTTAGSLDGFSHSNERLTYTGTPTRSFKVDVAASIEPDSGAARVLGISIAKNGTVIAQTEIRHNGTSNDLPNALKTIGYVSLATNDYIEVFVTNHSGTQAIRVTYLHVIIRP